MSISLENILTDNVVELVFEYYDQRKPLEWEHIVALKYRKMWSIGLHIRADLVFFEFLNIQEDRMV